MWLCDSEGKLQFLQEMFPCSDTDSYILCRHIFMHLTDGMDAGKRYIQSVQSSHLGFK